MRLVVRGKDTSSVHDQATRAVEGEVPAAAVLEQLERVLGSDDFDASPRSKAFLRFIVEETLAGRQEALTQVAIATRVFRRREDFDPTVDPIVRIQAGRLRRSLERYYLLAGCSDAVRIELPRGTYVPIVDVVSRPPARGERSPLRDVPGGDWPTVVLDRTVEPCAPELEEPAKRFEEALAIELGRYADVRVVLRPEGDDKGHHTAGGGRFVLSWHLRQAEGTLRAIARLLDRVDASQVWAEEFRGERSERGTLEPFVEHAARAIAALVAAEHGVIARRLWAERRHTPLGRMTAYDAILRSYHFLFNRDGRELEPAVRALQRVVREQPECGLAWIQLARLYIANYSFELAPLSTPIDDAIAFAQNGVRLEPSRQRARAALAGALIGKGELAAGRAEAEKALELNPDSLVYLEWVGWLLAMSGDWERGAALVRRAMTRNPNYIPAAAHALWVDHVRRGEFEAAHQVTLQFRDPASFWRALMGACCLGHLGRVEEARREVTALLSTKPDFATRGRTLIERYVKFPEIVDRIVDGVRKAGLALA